MRFKCKVLLLGQGNSRHEYSLGEEPTESSPVEQDLGILVDENLDMSQQSHLFFGTHTPENRQYPGLPQKQTGQQVKGHDSCPLLHTLPPGELYPSLET